MIIRCYYDRKSSGAQSRIRGGCCRREEYEAPMRYEKGHKEATRQHIIDVASKQFRESGVAAAGLAGVMSAAGLTNGAFSAHFESKEDLVGAVLSDALGQRERGLAGNL